MNDTMMGALIGVGGTLIGTVLGFALQFPYNYFRDKREVKKKWVRLKKMIQYEKLESSLVPIIEELRLLMIEDEHLMKVNEDFFNKYFDNMNYHAFKQSGHLFEATRSIKSDVNRLYFNRLEKFKKRFRSN